MNTSFRTFSLALGALVTVALLALVVTVLLLRRATQQARAYVDDTIPRIAESWDAQILTQEAATEFHENASQEDIAKLCDTLAERLGPLRDYRGSRGRVKMSASTGGGIVVRGAYRAECAFANESAIIDVGIVRRNGDWGIVSFFVTSDAIP